MPPHSFYYLRAGMSGEAFLELLPSVFAVDMLLGLQVPLHHPDLLLADATCGHYGFRLNKIQGLCDVMTQLKRVQQLLDL